MHFRKKISKHISWKTTGKFRIRHCYALCVSPYVVHRYGRDKCDGSGYEADCYNNGDEPVRAARDRAGSAGRREAALFYRLGLQARNLPRGDGRSREGDTRRDRPALAERTHHRYEIPNFPQRQQCILWGRAGACSHQKKNTTFCLHESCLASVGPFQDPPIVISAVNSRDFT